MDKALPVSVVIPTYKREQILLDTVQALRELEQPPGEILLIDQTPRHETETEARLAALDQAGAVRWLRLPQPSIPHAMNTGLMQAKYGVVLFLDDDIVPGDRLIAEHWRRHQEPDTDVVAGKVIQPWEKDKTAPNDGRFYFYSDTPCEIEEFMGGNISIKRDLALRLKGFDENFIGVAYRFEREFADRIRNAGIPICFEPQAGILHLKVSAGGTRTFGEHLTTVRPDHAVGEYYYLLCGKRVQSRWLNIGKRLMRSVMTRHHALKPWWVPLTLFAELWGLSKAVRLYRHGPQYPV